VTRAVVTAITNGSLEGCDTEHLDVLNLDIPRAIAGVDSKYLNPRNAWDNTEAYDEQASKLARLFVENIHSFEPSKEIVDAGPQLETASAE
jgi:phosphoenolpyruvate carboxykinase (ATP)